MLYEFDTYCWSFGEIFITFDVNGSMKQFDLKNKDVVKNYGKQVESGSYKAGVLTLDGKILLVGDLQDYLYIFKVPL